ncbi:MAG: alpha-mannosidase, partial [Actinomycetes bacterium]
FLTQKLSWNRTNRFPHHSFWWEGIDGSTVFTHFPPVETYNSTVDAHELAHAVRTFTDKGRATRSLLPFGYGDGGGGPTARMLGQYHRAKDLEGSPRLQIEAPSTFFDKAVEEYSDAPRWVGELYFEMHRGTFTSQAATKAGNRRCEALLREAETWVVAAHGTDAAAPDVLDRLDRLWKDVLLHQFHDILPGSSIGWVHREAAETYARVADELEEVISRAAAAVSPTAERRAVWINPSPFPFRGVVAHGSGPVWVDAAPMAVAEPAAGLPDGVTPVSSTDGPDGTVLDNGLVRVVIDTDGHVASLVDLATGREAVAPGHVAGVLQLHPDLPAEYDAWDIEDYDVRRPVPVVGTTGTEVLETGPLVARVRVSRSDGPSTFEQTYELTAGSSRLDVHCDVDWQHRERLLKVAFPLDVHTDQATREIQFGQLTTPIHTNTSWDTARFEFCAHRWVHVGEPGFGVAVLNDGKYGYDAQRARSVLDDGTEVPTTTVRLSLLKAAVWPDPVQDRGAHRFTYSLLPGNGRVDDGTVVAEGYRLNQPPRPLATTGTGVAALAPPAGTVVVSSDSPVVVVEAVKPADDRSGDVVVRCYESAGSRTRTTLRLGFPASTARTTDARERDLPGHLSEPVVDGAVDLELRPFEVRTVRITR